MRRLSLILVLAVLSAACNPVYWLGVRLYYDRAPAPAAVQTAVPYDPMAPDDPKRQLDLYLPAASDFPTVVFVHGGGWTWGDRTQQFGGADVYRNVGRFLAAQGFGAAVISYRLVWDVDWRTQLRDVARAIAWVQRTMPARGGRADRVFLVGHSAGAQLAARVAVDPHWITAEGGNARGICGTVAVSGIAYDLGDIDTYRIGHHQPTYFAERFGGSRLDGTWWRDASVVPFVDADDPPFLLMYATAENAAMAIQAKVLGQHLARAGVPHTVRPVRSSGHEQLVLDMSRGRDTVGPAMLRFLRETPCPRP